MASPMPMANMGNWGEPRQTMPASNESEEFGLQVRPMGLKVHYTFDREGLVGCLARHPQILQIQTIPLDDKSSIGIVDLKICLQAIAKCSPELVGQDGDYTVYAYDYSEPDVPLVGQGMLSWVLESSSDAPETQPKMVIGRVTKNLLAMFSGGIKETLEVKFKLTAAARIQRPDSRPERPHFQRAQSQMSVDVSSQGRQMESVMTPSGIAEWNSFVQSNPQLGQSANVGRVGSPALPQNRADMSQSHSRRESFNIGPSTQIPPPHQASEGPIRIAPTPVEASAENGAGKAPSRPSSRASTRPSRAKGPTGRPRGRPKKNQAPEVQGHTSGYEDGTDADEGPAKKKRATTQAVKKDAPNPFSGAPDSLRVAANMAGSIRNLRPIGMAGEAPVGNHLQEIPRAPTPIPEGPQKGRGGKPGGNSSKLRRESTLSQAATPISQPPYCEISFAMSPSQDDARSPLESEGASPMYSDDSQAGIGSSPPVPRTTPFVQSSPPPSSPILPPMPMPQLDSGFMSGDVDDLFGEMPLKPLEHEAPAAAPVPKSKKARSLQPKIPIQVFQLNEMQSLSSDIELVPVNSYDFGLAPTSTPSHAPTLPPLQRPHPEYRTESGPPAPSPLQQMAGKDPSPQPEEPVVAAEDVIMDDAVAPEKATSQPPPEITNTPSEELPLETSAVTLEESGYSAPMPEMRAPRLPSTESGASTRPLARSKSSGALDLGLPHIPASDPIGPLALPTLATATSFSEAPCPPSDAMPPPDSPQGPKSNKNFVKKQSIKQRLEKAIENGEMPPYCNNCGAIETPTWRKIWTQDRTGVPEFTEFSDKPGKVTAIIVLERDDEDKAKAYQLIKKGLAPNEDKSAWNELLLCNPCGIWLSKWKCHRPPDKWDKDYARLTQTRRPRGSGRAPRKRTKNSMSQMNPTSDAWFTTDPVGPDDQGSSPKGLGREASALFVIEGGSAFKREDSSQLPTQSTQSGSRGASPVNRSNPGSTHSRGSGTAKSPIAVDAEAEGKDDMGTTRRLLFPSPRKDGIPKVLCEVAVNIVQTGPEFRGPKEAVPEKENVIVTTGGNAGMDDDDELEALFRSPAAARPSTPPPKETSGHHVLFKTPTRATPSHRPVTRSISRSMRSTRSLKSPSQQALLQRTPTKTPRSVRRLMVQGSASIRRSPRIHHNAHFDDIFETPMTRTINQLLSDAHNCDFSDLVDHHGGMDFDVNNLPPLDNNMNGMIDFGNLLSTDAVMPSSPPGGNRMVSFDYTGSAGVWAQWNNAHGMNMDEVEEE